MAENRITFIVKGFFTEDLELNWPSLKETKLTKNHTLLETNFTDYKRNILLMYGFYKDLAGHIKKEEMELKRAEKRKECK